MTRTVNLNDTVLVRLTFIGRAAAIEALTVKDGRGRVIIDGEQMLDRHYPERPDGRREFQLWEVCRYLGQRMGNGFDNPIDMEIEFV
jgi:hypothetical protein